MTPTVAVVVELWKVPLLALLAATIIVIVLWCIYMIGQWRS